MSGGEKAAENTAESPADNMAESAANNVAENTADKATQSVAESAPAHAAEITAENAATDTTASTADAAASDAGEVATFATATDATAELATSAGETSNETPNETATHATTTDETANNPTAPQAKATKAPGDGPKAINPKASSPKPQPAKPKTAKAKAPRGLRQSMSDLHIWSGLLVGWVLYAMFLTGTVSYFREEITLWMRPELPAASRVHDQGAQAQRLVDALAVSDAAAQARQWNMFLPTERNPQALTYWSGPKGFGRGEFNAQTGEPLQTRATHGGDFFYRFHFQLHYFPVLWGRWIVSFCAMFMLVAIISGVITHKKSLRTFSPSAGARASAAGSMRTTRWPCWGCLSIS